MCIRFVTMLKSEIISFSSSSFVFLVFTILEPVVSVSLSSAVRAPGNKSAVTLKVKVEPKPTFDSKTISPFSRLQIFLHIESPRPTPLGFRWELNLRVQKSEKILPNSFSGIPVPVS